MIEVRGERAYTTRETAEILQRTTETIRNYARKGKLTGETIGNSYFFTETEIKKFIKKRG